MAEHRRAVNQLSVSSTGAFFVSASNDETVKVRALPVPDSFVAMKAEYGLMLSFVKYA